MFATPLNYAEPVRGARPSGLRISFGVVIVIVNYAVCSVGLFLNSFGGWVDHLGAVLCRATIAVAGPLVIGTAAYSVLRRAVLRKRAWDFYGPSLAIIGYLAAHVLIGRRPWWLPVVPGW